MSLNFEMPNIGAHHPGKTPEQVWDDAVNALLIADEYSGNPVKRDELVALLKKLYFGPKADD